MKRLIFVVVLAIVSLTLASCAEDRSGVSSSRKLDPTKDNDGKNPVVVLDTSLGVIKVELDPVHAPITVRNFLAYVDAKFYDGTIFHRVIPDFMIQGGGFVPGLKDAKSVSDIKAKEKETRAPIKNEAPNNLSNVRGTIAMARTGDPDSATAQFFINVKNKPHLDDPQSPYCVFGKVIDGMDVVDKIRNVKTTNILIPGARHIADDMPVEDVVIKSIRRADK